MGEAAQALGYSWRQCQRWFSSYREGGTEELLKSRVHERGRQEMVTSEALEDLKQTMKLGQIATMGRPMSSLESVTASSTLIRMASVNSSGDTRSS